ncbi:MAG: cupredoxin domain-containing protein [Pyrinomonadaceae bacterium]
MNRKLFTAVIFVAGVLVAAALTACVSPKANVNSTMGVESNPMATSEQTKPFSIDFTSEPAQIIAGTPANLIFRVKDDKGVTVRDLQIVHEKPMHLIVVSSDLAEFYHIHPEVQEDGSYRVTHTFPSGGAYKLFADFTPKDSLQVVEQIDLNVDGAARRKVELMSDTKLEKTIDGLSVVMRPSGELRAGEELTLDFKIFDSSTGKPVEGLQNYLGELAHFVLISQDLKDFVHAHPMAKGGSMGTMEMDKNNVDPESVPHDHSKTEFESKQDRSEVSAHTSFPRSGLYKIWAQFQRADRVIAVPFIVRVGDAETGLAKNDASIPPDAIKIVVSSEGYSPSSLSVKKGQPVKLAFFRKDANNCGGEVVFSKLDIRRKLPVGETVLVEFTPQEEGELTFACGMSMLKGKIIVN